MNLLSLLRIRSVVAGLEVSDELIRLAYFDHTTWRMHAVRLPPGTMENGKMKDRQAFLTAMNELRLQSKIAGHDKRRKIDVVVVLSSATAYSKVFRLPMLEGGELEKAIALNLQMASPSDASQVYGSSQIVGRDESAREFDVLASFMDRGLIDDLVDTLFEAGFIAVAAEPKSLALTRVFREKGSGIDIGKSYVMVSIDNSGLEFLIVRNGAPYFEYVNHWRDIANEKGEFSLDAFEEDLKASLRQVLNFYAQHWPEPLTAIILSNTLFPEEVEKMIVATFAMPAARLTLLMGQPISPEWLVALGSSLREAGLGSKTKEISFLGPALEDRFHAEEMGRFLEFWQVVFPVTLGILVAAFFVLDLFLNNTRASVMAESSLAAVSTQGQSLLQLEASATAFNTSVAMINTAESSIVPQSALLADISALADSNGITISHLTVAGGGVPVTLSATAASEDHITTFKQALEADPNVSSVSLPLTGIQSNPGNTYSFSVTFIYQQK